MKITICLSILCVVLLLVPPISIAGGAGGHRRNAEMTQAFNEGRPPADYRYYSTGRNRAPDAIIGLKPPWREIDLESQDLNRLIRSVMRNNQNAPEAFDIVDPDGEVIGVYWSTLLWPRVTVRGEYDVQVFKPREPLWR